MFIVPSRIHNRECSLWNHYILFQIVLRRSRLQASAFTEHHWRISESSIVVVWTTSIFWVYSPRRHRMFLLLIHCSSLFVCSEEELFWFTILQLRIFLFQILTKFSGRFIWRYLPVLWALPCIIGRAETGPSKLFQKGRTRELQMRRCCRLSAFDIFLWMIFS